MSGQPLAIRRGKFARILKAEREYLKADLSREPETTNVVEVRPRAIEKFRRNLEELAEILKNRGAEPSVDIARVFRCCPPRLSGIIRGDRGTRNLVDDAINQLRHFMGIYKCGIALVGNEEVYTRFNKSSGGPSYAQLKRRIGKRLKRATSYVEDIAAYISAWGVTSEDCVQFLLGVGKKGGALGQIDKTLKLAYMAAIGAEEELSLKHLKAAWSNRDVEDLQ